MDTLGHLSDGLAGVYNCHGSGGNQVKKPETIFFGNPHKDQFPGFFFQEWSLTKDGHVKHSELCLSLEEPMSGSRVKLRLCGESVLQVRLPATNIMQSLEYHDIGRRNF